jgi:hypothetical protein
MWPRHPRDPRLVAHCVVCAIASDAGKEGKLGGEVDPADCRCLVRAVGAKQKISAMIGGKEYRRFMQSYGNIMKISLDSLKKKEKKKNDKKKAA